MGERVGERRLSRSRKAADGDQARRRCPKQSPRERQAGPGRVRRSGALRRVSARTAGGRRARQSADGSHAREKQWQKAQAGVILSLPEVAVKEGVCGKEQVATPQIHQEKRQVIENVDAG